MVIMNTILYSARIILTLMTTICYPIKGSTETSVGLGDIGVVLDWLVETRRPLVTLIITTQSTPTIQDFLVKQLRVHQVTGESFSLFNIAAASAAVAGSCSGTSCVGIDDISPNSSWSDPFDLIYADCEGINATSAVQLAFNRLSSDGILVVRGINWDRRCWEHMNHLVIGNGKDTSTASGFFHIAAGGVGIVSHSSDFIINNFEQAFPDFITGKLKYPSVLDTPLTSPNPRFPVMFSLDPVDADGEVFKLLISGEDREVGALEVLIPTNAYSWTQFVMAIEDFLVASKVQDELIWRQVILKLMRKRINEMSSFLFSLKTLEWMGEMFPHCKITHIINHHPASTSGTAGGSGSTDTHHQQGDISEGEAAQDELSSYVVASKDGRNRNRNKKGDENSDNKNEDAAADYWRYSHGSFDIGPDYTVPLGEHCASSAKSMELVAAKNKPKQRFLTARVLEVLRDESSPL